MKGISYIHMYTYVYIVYFLGYQKVFKMPNIIRKTSNSNPTETPTCDQVKSDLLEQSGEGTAGLTAANPSFGGSTNFPKQRLGGVLADCPLAVWTYPRVRRHSAPAHFCVQAADLVRVTFATLSQNKGLRPFR